ncbi:iron-containing alcohol dehydrogenase family protein [Guptibacillus hwajinpoensis]|uniref:Glycerol-1-phosphate dehydrogenase [NAD(P)+] n=1 Tax=Guptibacillus hwajinpoensis TaxID=208199 RepID=A0ABU0K1G5_9BACL|nr:iron-containing alcohol dehydrogenase family protein [Alkalihalobacillus hemicentroti]MDQ0483197.1 glycerol-1-phosphate dehydrogenase [NAD(P)+] [Alkalihalobacillus hemicentroti]
MHALTNIPIPSILEIRSGIRHQLESILIKHDFKNALFLFDDFTYLEYAETFHDTFKEVSLTCQKMEPRLTIDELIRFAFSMDTYDVVVAMGGGMVIDYGKYIAFSRKMPFISMPTSASNDGFASSNCSLIVNNKKTTVPAQVPYGIIADLEVIQQAPPHFLLAGVGDLMSNITALYDWEFEERKGVGHVNAFASMLSKKAVNSFIRTPMNDISNPIFIKELVSSLTMGGVATVISGNSAPISGSEHLISHALDKRSLNPHMHGIQVGIATYIIANVQEHRADRMRKVFERTGFFHYLNEQNLKKDDLKDAILFAPSVKPSRYTYLHDDNYREKALVFLDQDPLLQDLLN